MTERLQLFPGLVAAAALGLGVPASAPASPAEVERCRQEPDLEARVACLEAALRDQAEVGDGEDGEPPPAAIEDAPVPAAPETPLPPVEPEVREQLDVPLGEDEEPVPDPPAADDPELGAEQLAGDEKRAAPRSATGLRVERYERVPFRRLEVHLENGQVWRQIEGDTQEIRATLRKNRTVDIEESALGGYRLRLNEMRRTIRVQRIK